jgi:hypothetical protein
LAVSWPVPQLAVEIITLQGREARVCFDQISNGEQRLLMGGPQFLAWRAVRSIIVTGPANQQQVGEIVPAFTGSGDKMI